jgi:hypothetical protein
LPLGFHRGKLSLIRVAETPQLGGNLIRFGLPIEKHCVIVVKTLVLSGERLSNDGQCRTVGMSVRCA